MRKKGNLDSSHIQKSIWVDFRCNVEVQSIEIMEDYIGEYLHNFMV